MKQLLIIILFVQVISFSQTLKPIKVKEKNGIEKYGYSLDGKKLVIEPLYDRAEDFKEGFAIVAVNGFEGAINQKGEIVIPIKYLKVGTPQNGFITVRVRKDYLYGLYNTLGVKLLEENYNEITFCKNDSIVIYGKDISQNLGPLNYGYVRFDGTNTGLKYGTKCDFANGLALVSTSDFSGYINTQLKEIITFNSDYRLENFYCGRAKIFLKNKYGFINEKGNVIIPIEYDNASNFTNNIAAVYKKNNVIKYGFIDLNGKLVSEIKYEGTSDLDRGNSKEIYFNGRIPVYYNNKYGFINYQGIEVIPCSYDKISSLNSHAVRVAMSKRSFDNPKDRWGTVYDKWGIINENGEIILPLKYDEINSSYKENYFVAGFYYRYKNLQLTHWGLIDINGKELTEFKYDKVFNLKNGLIKVGVINKNDLMDREKWGIINEKGVELTSVKYDEIDEFSEGISIVIIEDLKGYINEKGEEITKIEFQRAGLFSKGKGRINLNGRDGYVDINGKIFFDK